MKKRYITPQIKMQVVLTELLQVASGVKGKFGGNVEIDWGGIDANGSLDPSSNSFGKIWDDDDWDKL